MPASVTVTLGTPATFDITTHAVTRKTKVKISESLGGKAKTATLTVTP